MNPAIRLFHRLLHRLLYRSPHRHRGWFTAVGAAIACIAAAACRADVIGEHPGTAAEQAVYRAWAADDAWNPAGQSDNYPFKPSEAAMTNHGIHHPDLVAESGDGSIRLRTSTAYAGAISQLIYRDQELLHATVGAAMQFHIRYSDAGSMKFDDVNGWQFLLDECQNPTQAGNSRDTPPRSYTADSYGQPRRFNERHEWFSNVNIRQWSTLGWRSPLTGEIFDNVVQIDAQVHLPAAFRAKKFLQVELIAYLRRWAWSQESFVMGSAPGFVAEPWGPGSDGVIQAGFAPGGGEAGSARGFFNIDRTFGMAILSFNNKADVAKIARDTEPRPVFLAYPNQPSIYSRSVRSGGGADCPNPFTARTIQADFQFTSPGDMVSAHSFVVLGSPEEIERSIRAIVTFARSANSPFVTSSR